MSAAAPSGTAPEESSGDHELHSIGAAAQLLGVSERALRYYQQLGLVNPCARTPGGMRRYSDEDLARVSRIRELQSLLGLELEEIAEVLQKEDRIIQIRERYRDERTSADERRQLLVEGLELQEHLRQTVEAKRSALDEFLARIDQKIARIQELLGGC